MTVHVAAGAGAIAGPGSARLRRDSDIGHVGGAIPAATRYRPVTFWRTNAASRATASGEKGRLGSA